MSLLRSSRVHFDVPAVVAPAKRSVEECASLFTWVAAAAAAVAAAASGVGGGNPNTTRNNVEFESIPEVLTIGEALLSRPRTHPSYFGTYDHTHISQDFIGKYDNNGDSALSRAEFNNALKNEGFDIQVSEDAFAHFDNGYDGSGHARRRGDFLRANDIHDGKLTADELGHMQDEYVGDELVVRVDKVTGEHTLDIADEYKGRAFQDFMEVEAKATKQRDILDRKQQERRNKHEKERQRKSEKQQRESERQRQSSRDYRSWTGGVVSGLVGSALAGGLESYARGSRSGEGEGEGEGDAPSRYGESNVFGAIRPANAEEEGFLKEGFSLQVRTHLTPIN